MSEVMKTLCQLNSYSCKGQRNLLLRNMKVNEKYVILSAHRHIKKKSGKSMIKLILDKYYIYLPKRFNSLPNHFLSEINENKNYMIENCGQWKNTYNLVFSNSEQLNEIVTYDIQDLLNEYTYCPQHYTASIE